VFANNPVGTSDDVHSKTLFTIYSTIPKYKKGALIVSQT